MVLIYHCQAIIYVHLDDHLVRSIFSRPVLSAPPEKDSDTGQAGYRWAIVTVKGKYEVSLTMTPVKYI